MAVAKEQAEKPFEHTERLKELLSEQTQLNTELNLDKREEVIIEDEDDDASDGYYKALPVMSKAIMEEEMIDREDKTAMIQTAVLPDYAVTQERMHGYGYSWDGMLPLTRQTALRLWGMGLQVYKLNTNDTEAEVESTRTWTTKQRTTALKSPHGKSSAITKNRLPILRQSTKCQKRQALWLRAK